jgi:hypothetical protein
MANATILGAVKDMVLAAIGTPVGGRVFELGTPDAASAKGLPKAIVGDAGATYQRNSEAEFTSLGGYEVRRVKVIARSKTQHNAQALVLQAAAALMPVTPQPPSPPVPAAVQVTGATTTYVHLADGQVILTPGPIDPETGVQSQDASLTLVIRVTRP